MYSYIKSWPLGSKQPLFALYLLGIAFHWSDLATKAHWQHDGNTRELPLDDGHPRPHWHIKLDGNLQQETNIEVTPSFEEPGMALVVRMIDVILAKALC